MFKIDLHTHSTASPDGGVTADQYRDVLANGTLDCVAITDHNAIDFATWLQAELGDQIIVGEEIMTNQGEIIGLYLEELVPAGLSPAETIERIKQQGGLVYIPHPFETVRNGLPPQVMDELSELVDVLEVYNGRAFAQDRSKQAVVWARLNRIPGAASSDAHGRSTLGKTYNQCQEMPTKQTLRSVLANSTPIVGRPGIRDLLYPKYNRTRKKIGRA